ncbi:class I SAM-dependent methyltransferase [Paracoccus tegillarcae]|uniref:SAM-dependent methyltransferase n=1 Tax=Paracoccus tegillarcae TaxID=1529068 RepID=A0A2K9EIY2_9RHOB|nr:class I SAM-dependent methyltransferase [Paracoccus tegillarcae]AUH34950.1 SAM-dependent methyltransferase [Paracoccus tegillarcae]
MAQTIDSTRFWDRAARKYAKSKIGDVAGYERTLKQISQYVHTDQRLLEIGCGTGTTALRLAPSADHILATDISPEMIAIAHEKAQAQGCTNITFQTAGPDGAGWQAEGFDLIYGMNVLHLVKARGLLLRSVYKALKPGGLFISKTPCLTEMTVLLRPVIPVMQWIGKAPYVSFLSAAQLQQDLRDAGFEIVRLERHGSKAKDIRPFIVAAKPADKPAAKP